MNNKTLRLLLLALATVSHTAVSNQQPLETIPVGLVHLSDATDNRSRTWTGIGRLRGDNTSYCTASLIDTRTADNPTGTTPAYIITSHRCLNSKNHGQYTYSGGIQHNMPTKGTIYFNNFDNTLDKIKSYELDTIAWQSDGGLNLAIIELKAPLSKLIADGIQPLKIARRTPPTGTEILTLGIPEYSNLHATHCTQQPAVNIASYPWVGTNVLANHCTNLTLGGLGGPVVDKASNELISVLLASTHGAISDDKCLANTPCELTGNTTHWSPDTHYTQPVSFLNQCFVQGRLAATAPECALYKLTSVTLEEPRQPPARILEKLASDESHEPDTFAVGATVGSPFYRYKYVHDANTCHNSTGYSQAISSTETNINFTLNDDTGLHLLCIIGVESHNDRLTSAQFNAAKIIVTERVAIKQEQANHMKVSRSRKVDEFYYADWYHRSPLLGHYKIKHGPYESTDCTNNEGYIEIPDYEVRTRDSGPWAEEYEHKAHPTNPELILVKETKEQLIEGAYTKIIEPKESVFKLCTVVFNLNNEPSEPRTDILRPL